MKPDPAWLTYCSECDQVMLRQPPEAIRPRDLTGPPEALVVDYIARRAAHLRCVDPDQYADVVFIRRGIEECAG